jgi:uncharacterized protein (DUF885 family)
MKKQTGVLLLAIALFSCAGENKKEMNNAEYNDSTFNTYKEAFVLRMWKMYPVWASSVGYHNYDSILYVPDETQRKKELDFVNGELDSLKHYSPEKLNDNNRTDFYLIENQLKASAWGINDMKAYEWDPSSYNIGSTFGDMINNTYDTLDTRLHNFYLRMKNIPAYYEAAKKNIKNPTLEHTQLAIEQNLGSTSIFEKDLKDALEKSHLTSQEKESMMKRADESVNAIKSYAEWLKNLKNDNPRTFRLGKNLYEKKFEYDIMSAYTPEQMYKKAEDHKAELHRSMAELAIKLWPKYMGKIATPTTDTLKMIKMVIDKISENHVKPEEFQSSIEKQLKDLAAFVNKKDLLYMDPSKPLVVRKEPEYMAGVAGASINAPGPYDKGGNTYYNVGSLSGWTKEKSESYLREYNHYILQILNIHEAIPGHYTQLVYSNQSPSIIKSILGNGSMVEGWAVYSERMMLEEGYGENAPEMWLMYFKWNLRATCNFILDYSVHTGNMTKEEAINFLTNEAFQQQTEAENKWRRVSLTQVQLTSYFNGYTEIYELRNEIKQKLGDKFNLKKFHEKFLSYGSSPVKYIRELMLKDLDSMK